MAEGGQGSPWRDGLWNFWGDMGFVRRVWTNTAQIAPGVFRSNQPDPARLARMQAQGLRAVLFLRGSASGAPYRVEQAACAALGLSFHLCHLSAHRLPQADQILGLIDLFRSIDKPFLMHCRAGADRTGLASAIYLLAIEHRPVAEARAMLSARFGHWRWSSTGILDQLVLAYGAAQRSSGIGFADWIATDYDPAAITCDFQTLGLAGRIRAMRGES